MKSDHFDIDVVSPTQLLTFILPIYMFGSCAGFLVYPRLLESRSGDDRLILHVHSGLTIRLEKSSILAKKLYFESSSFDDSHTAVLDGETLEKSLYHNSEHMSSLVIQKVRSGVEVRGILNHQLRIAPAVEVDHSNARGIPHRIFDVRERSTSSSVEGRVKAIPDVTISQTVTASQENAREHQNTNIPDNFTVETCLVISTNYSLSFNTTEELLLYLASMMNSMALMYTEMTCPAIHFQLNKLWVVMDEYLFYKTDCGKANNRFKHELNSTVCGYNAEVTLNKTIDHINLCETSMCDVVYHLTSVDLTYTENGTFSTDIIGLAEIGAACTSHNFAVGEDIPHTYLGLTTMAHEIGHLLGANHDDLCQKEECSASYGYLMSTLEKGMKNKSKLSICSQEQIQAFVRNLSATCINVSGAASFSNDHYPGEKTTKEVLCKLLHPGHPDVFPSLNYTEECEFECCWKTSLDIESREDSSDSPYDYGSGSYDDYYSGTGLTCSPHAMLDGMPCDEDNAHTCKKGVCGDHNRTRIRQKYGTLRTFEKL